LWGVHGWIEGLPAPREGVVYMVEDYLAYFASSHRDDLIVGDGAYGRYGYTSFAIPHFTPTHVAREEEEAIAHTTQDPATMWEVVNASSVVVRIENDQGEVLFRAATVWHHDHR
jgi:hypothetical protein